MRNRSASHPLRTNSSAARRRPQRLSLTTLLFSLVLALFYLTGLTRALDHVVLDAWFRLRGVRPPGEQIVIVKLDQDFVDAYDYRIGDLDRGFYARALNNLAAAGASAVGMDLFFPERSSSAPGRNPDEELAEAILTHEVVLPHVRARTAAAGRFSLNDHVPFNPLLEDAKRGVLSLDETAYELTSVVTFRDGVLPSFPLAVLQAAGLEVNRPLGPPLLIDYRGPANTFPSLSFLNVYRNQFSYASVQDKLVLLGVTLQGTDQDQILTPYGLMPGVEVNANALYTLLFGRLIPLSPPLYALALILSALVWPYPTRRKGGLRWALAGTVGLFAASFLLFRLHLFVSPLWLASVPLAAYLSSSYRHLLRLDTELTRRLGGLLDTATLADTGELLPTNLSQGFAPKGYVTHAPDMLESLMRGLGGESGLLLIEQGKTSSGEVSDILNALVGETLSSRRAQTQGSMPHHVTEPIFLDGSLVGVVGLTLPAPLPPHLRTLLKTSVGMFSQLARYQQLRERTETLVDTFWPWRSQSSLDKIDALAMVGDLLATERSWLGALLETLTQAVFIMSPYGYGVYENAAARRLFKNEKNMLRALPEALKLDPERFTEDYARTVERGEALELGLTERESDRPVLLSLRVIRSGGEVKGVAGMVSDLSKVEELDRKRQELIGMVVHDLRSPLTSIQGFAELLLDDAEDDKRDSLLIISQEATRMRRMTDVFLDVVRLEADAFTPELETSNVAELLRYAVASASAQASQKNILIALHAPTYVGALVDAELIRRMMINLLSNAIKYSPAGTRISATLAQTSSAVQLDIVDQGYGMSEAQQRTLFQKYKRAPEGKARAISGTGLGLYLVKLVVDAHNGRITVDSAPNRGSRFRVELPLTPMASELGDLRESVPR